MSLRHGASAAAFSAHTQLARFRLPKSRLPIDHATAGDRAARFLSRRFTLTITGPFQVLTLVSLNNNVVGNATRSDAANLSRRCAGGAYTGQLFADELGA